MNKLRIPSLLFVALVLATCSDRPQPRPIASDDYDIYSELIKHTLSEIRQYRDVGRQVFVRDTTRGEPIHRRSKSPEDAESERNAVIHDILQSYPDTLQLAEIEQDYSRQNRQPFLINLDSLRPRLALDSIAIAGTPMALPPRTCSFTFSKVAFNETFDHAMVLFTCRDYTGSTTAYAYCLNKKGRWDLAYTRYWSWSVVNY